MHLDKNLEDKLFEKIKPLLENSRPGWNLSHTISSVHWMKKLIEKEGGDERILITAMYMHDVGYETSLKKGYQFEESMKVKEKDHPDNHMKIGAEYCKQILPDLGYTSKEIEKIARLVLIHDDLEEIERSYSENDLNAQLVMEADSLAQIDVEQVTPTFNKKSCFEFNAYFEKERMSKFKTDAGKEFLPSLYAKFINYICNLKE